MYQCSPHTDPASLGRVSQGLAMVSAILWIIFYYSYLHVWNFNLKKKQFKWSAISIGIMIRSVFLNDYYHLCHKLLVIILSSIFWFIIHCPTPRFIYATKATHDKIWDENLLLSTYVFNKNIMAIFSNYIPFCRTVAGVALTTPNLNVSAVFHGLLP